MFLHSLFLPEIFPTVNAGQHLATPAHAHVFIHLSFFQRFPARVAGEKHHFEQQF